MAKQYGFFPKADNSLKIDYTSLINLISKDKSLINELIVGITYFKNNFEIQTKSSSPKEHEELEAGIKRCAQRIVTLRNIESNRPVTDEEKKLLMDFIYTIQRVGAKIFPDLHEKLQDLFEQKSPNIVLK